MDWHSKLQRARLCLPSTKQHKLEQDLGLSKGTISDYETGRTREMPEHFRIKWDQVYGHLIPADWILNGIDDYPPNVPAPTARAVKETPATYASDDVKAVIADLMSNNAKAVLSPKVPMAYRGPMPAIEPVSSATLRNSILADPKFAQGDNYITTIVAPVCHPVIRQSDKVVWCVDESPPDLSIVEVHAKNIRTIRELRIDRATGAVRLEKLNAAYPEPDPEGEWTVVARLVGVIRKGKRAEISWDCPDGLHVDDLIPD